MLLQISQNVYPKGKSLSIRVAINEVLLLLPKMTSPYYLLSEKTRAAMRYGHVERMC